MSLEELEQSVAALPKEKLARFREWFHQYENELWDQQIEQDAKAGRLDSLADDALKEHQAGESTEL